MTSSPVGRVSVRWNAILALGAAAMFGCCLGNALAATRCAPTPSPPPPPRSKFEERGPPTKAELGQASWTLLHTVAANYPDAPTKDQEELVISFLHALGHLYPCPHCASHFRAHYQQRPIVASSRESLSLWLCAAHNEVNIRNGKGEFFCDLGVLDARWKDCGCGGNKSHAHAHAHPYVQHADTDEAHAHRRRRPRAGHGTGTAW
jgi:FAD-linked sulfhydryl oxidase